MKKLIFLLPVFFFLFLACDNSPSENTDPCPLVSPVSIDASSGDEHQTFQLLCRTNPDGENLYDMDGDVVTVVVDSATPLPDCMTLDETTGVLQVSRTENVSGIINFWTIDDRGGSSESEALNVTFNVTVADGASAPGVYIAGYYIDSSGGDHMVACYWKDGVKIDLYNVVGHDAEARSIYVNGEDVYVSGYYMGSSFNIACYWKNGTKIDLPSTGTGTGSEGYSIFVSLGNVYIAGFYNNENGQNACYWKNSTSSVSTGTVSLEILKTAVYAKAEGIYIVGNVVYAAGFYGATDAPYYWKDDSGISETALPWGGVSYGYAKSILVSNGIVYIAGYQVDKSCYWIDSGTPSQIELDTSQFAQAYGLSLSGTDVYVVGRYYNSTDDVTRACYWKNNSSTKMELPQDTATGSSANAIALSNGKIHIAGYDVESTGSGVEAAVYWNDIGSLEEVKLYSSSKAVSNNILVVE